MGRINVSLKDSTEQRLKAWADKKGRSVSSVVSEAIEEYFQQEENEEVENLKRIINELQHRLNNVETVLK